MQPTTILLARHGETIWNREGNRYCGITDIALSERGLEQARLLGEALRDVPLAAVYASDLTRAQITAAPAAALHGLTVQVEPGVRETSFGEFEGCTPAELAVARPAEFHAWRDDPEGTPPPGGETVKHAWARARAALSEIARRHPGETVLVVAHNTLNRIVICEVLGAPAGHYRRMAQDNCCINTFLWGPDEVTLVSANETAHLRRPAPRRPELAGRVAFITGAASGIGRATALRFAREGASVVLADIDEPGAREAAAAIGAEHGAGRALAVGMDVTREEDVLRAFRDTLQAYGGVDIVVNNAGLGMGKPIEETTVADWEHLHSVLATGYFMVAREAFRNFSRQGRGGSLVFVASKNALVGGKNISAYSAAKGAELQMARCLAEEGGARSIRVNTVCPDAVIKGTRIFSPELRAERARAYRINEEELEEHYRQRTTLKVSIYPEDVAEAILFFASDRSAKTTGCILTVDGGVQAAYVR